MLQVRNIKFSELFTNYGYTVDNKQVSVNHDENHDIVIWCTHDDSRVSCGFFFTEGVGWSMQASAENITVERGCF